MALREAGRPVAGLLHEIAFRRVQIIVQRVQAGDEVAVEVSHVLTPWETEGTTGGIRTTAVALAADVHGVHYRHVIRVHDRVRITTTGNVAAARSVAFFATDPIIDRRILGDVLISVRRECEPDFVAARVRRLALTIQATLRTLLTIETNAFGDTDIHQF